MRYLRIEILDNIILVKYYFIFSLFCVCYGLFLWRIVLVFVDFYVVTICRSTFIYNFRENIEWFETDLRRWDAA